MRIGRASGVIGSLFLLGCSTLSYQEPQTGPRAKVRFVTETDEVAVLWSYDDAACKTNESEVMRLRVGFLVNSNPKRLGLPLWDFHANAAKEIYFDASKPKYFLFSGDSIDPPDTTMYSCAVPFSFHFEANKDYEVAFKWHPQNCRVVISELTGEGSSASRVSLAVADNRARAESSGCMDQFKKTRLY